LWSRAFGLAVFLGGDAVRGARGEVLRNRQAECPDEEEKPLQAGPEVA
jgi:hypothetical protein